MNHSEEREFRVELPEGGELIGDLIAPVSPQGLVVFAHGSGSSRHSVRNRQVAESLRSSGLATLLLDLLTVEEDLDRSERFDIDKLSERLMVTIDRLGSDADVGSLPMGLFGASTGAAGALVAAAARPDRVGAVVSRGGRPDLAGGALDTVQAPTLLIVGGADEAVLGLNREALARLRSEAALEIVPGATHLFEEPGALDAVADVAGAWFVRHLGPKSDE